MLWSGPGPELMPEKKCIYTCTSIYICQIECHKACQIECQNKYQMECQKECQIECHKCFQMICLKLCQNCVSGWGYILLVCSTGSTPCGMMVPPDESVETLEGFHNGTIHRLQGGQIATPSPVQIHAAFIVPSEKVLGPKKAPPKWPSQKVFGALRIIHNIDYILILF